MGKKMKLDFSGIESFVKCAEGQHVVKLIEIEEAESQAGNDMLSATFQVVKGGSTGAKLYDNFVLTEKALWKLQSYLTAVGIKADGKVMLDLDKLVGKVCIVEVAHEEYDGKTRARIQEFKKLSAAKSDEDDDEEDIEDDIEEEDEEDTPKKSSKKASSKKAPKKAVEEDEDDEDWEEEEEEPAPKKKSKSGEKKSKPEAKKSSKKSKPVEDDDEDWDEDEWDDED